MREHFTIFEYGASVVYMFTLVFREANQDSNIPYCVANGVDCGFDTFLQA